jgi:hypothetical protein
VNGGSSFGTRPLHYTPAKLPNAEELKAELIKRVIDQVHAFIVTRLRSKIDRVLHVDLTQITDATTTFLQEYLQDILDGLEKRGFNLTKDDEAVFGFEVSL